MLARLNQQASSGRRSPRRTSRPGAALRAVREPAVLLGAADKAQVDELAGLYGGKQITAREWLTAKKPIADRSDIERRLRRATGTAAHEASC